MWNLNYFSVKRWYIYTMSAACELVTDRIRFWSIVFYTGEIRSWCLKKKKTRKKGINTKRKKIPETTRLVSRMTNPIYRAALYYFLIVYFKGLLQTLKLYAGHPQDLVKCNADFDVSTKRNFSKIIFQFFIK